MSESNSFFFRLLQIIAGVIFAGLCTEAGGLVVNSIFGHCKPEFIQNTNQN